jgi:hypothetical protein
VYPFLEIKKQSSPSIIPANHSLKGLESTKKLDSHNFIGIIEEHLTK